jgi:hypothetical protein
LIAMYTGVTHDDPKEPNMTTVRKLRDFFSSRLFIIYF